MDDGTGDALQDIFCLSYHVTKLVVLPIAKYKKMACRSSKFLQDHIITTDIGLLHVLQCRRQKKSGRKEGSTSFKLSSFRAERVSGARVQILQGIFPEWPMRSKIGGTGRQAGWHCDGTSRTNPVFPGIQGLQGRNAPASRVWMAIGRETGECEWRKTGDRQGVDLANQHGRDQGQCLQRR